MPPLVQIVVSAACVVLYGHSKSQTLDLSLSSLLVGVAWYYQSNTNPVYEIQRFTLNSRATSQQLTNQVIIWYICQKAASTPLLA